MVERKKHGKESIREIKEPRSSNIELLRILCALGVIVLHYNNSGMGNAFTYVEGNEINLLMLYLLESLVIVGVNVFILISGFFLSVRQDRSLWQPIKLIIQVIIMNFGINVISMLANHSFSTRSLIGSLIPNNYFVILYCVLYIVSPYINLIITKISNAGLKRLILILIMVFGCYATFVDLLGELTGREIIGLSSIGMYGSQWGYSIVNFMMMYVIGCAIRRDVFNNIKTKNIIMCICINMIIMVLWNTIAHKNSFRRMGAWDYDNPLVIVNASLVFLLFKRLEIKNVQVSKIINQLAKGSFTVFLVHGYFLQFLQIEKFAKENVFILLIHIVASTVIIYFVGYIIYFLYEKVMNTIFQPLQKRNKLLINYKITE